MATPPKGTDRRVRRTREVIRRAFLDIVQEKGLAGASIREITARADVSRGTFYAHYADKYALADSILREGFQQTVSNLPANSGWNRESLHLLIQTMLDYFKTIYQRHHRSRELAPLLEQATHQELTTLLLTWLRQADGQTSPVCIPLETVAQMVSWSIFGAAVQWSQQPSAISSEQMAHDILTVVMDGVGHLVPETLPE